MIAAHRQIYWMALILCSFGLLYCFPFEQTPLLTFIAAALLFPVQLLLWRLIHGRKAKDFFFCFTVLILVLFLNRYWQFSDLLFYSLAIMTSAVLRYRTFVATGLSAGSLEIVREHFYGNENTEDIAFRYLLFLAAGSLTYLLLWEEKRQKEAFKKELDDLKYGIHQVDDASVAALSLTDQMSRAVDAAVALDESLQNALQLISNVFKPDTAALWQFLADKKQLRIRNLAGNREAIKQNLVFGLGEGAVGWTALNKKTFLQQDRETGVAYPVYRKNQMVRSLLAVPILEGERLEGVLSLDSSHLNFFAVDAEKALLSFAAQISETIRMARLAREREERAVEFQAFYHASKVLSSIIEFDEIIQKLHSLCMEIVPSDFTAIAVLQDDGTCSIHKWRNSETGSRMEAAERDDGKTWISWFVRNREEPLIISESQLKLQEMPLLLSGEDLGELIAFLAIPMRHQQKCIGALLLGSRLANSFTSHQSRILSILCNQAAVSLENSSIIQNMEELAITDGLTGVFNHRYFQEALEKELERSQRQNQKLSLLILDIDHFKSFNDSFGHPAGDFVLKSLANLLRQNGRKIDVLARYGGEEFAGLLPGIDIKNARKTAERWRKSVQRSAFKWEDKSFAITVSMGFATFPDDADNKIELIEKADRALYDAKENGRNQVRHISDSQPKSRLFG